LLFVVNEATKLGYLSSQSVVLVPGDEFWLEILDFVGDGMHFVTTETVPPRFTQLWTILTC
jgi:hypothetical protein